jgi:hypothetical protein
MFKYLRGRVDTHLRTRLLAVGVRTSDNEEWVTFKTDGKGSISEFRKDNEIHHGADRELWPLYIQPVFEHIYSEGWPITTLGPGS